MRKLVAIAIGAHPDDIEFYMAGTLVLLKRAGWKTHYLNVGNGCCGSAQHDAKKTRIVRRLEAKRAAKVLGAQFHESLCNDLEIFYELKLLRRLAAVIREVKPNVVLTHAPADYMEDHTNTSRLAVTAAFAHAMPNFRSAPPRPFSLAAISREIGSLAGSKQIRSSKQLIKPLAAKAARSCCSRDYLPSFRSTCSTMRSV